MSYFTLSISPDDRTPSAVNKHSFRGKTLCRMICIFFTSPGPVLK